MAEETRKEKERKTSDILLEQQKQKTPAPDDPTREAFLTQPLGGLILKNALPAVASMLFMALYQVVDAILVGRRLGPEALASVNILFPILSLLVGLAVMIGVGGNARIAVLLGSGETSKARRALGLVVALGFSLGVVGSLVVSLSFPQILAALGASGALGDYAGNYLSSLYIFFTPMILIFILEQSIRNDGRPNMATIVMVGTAVLNILLDYLFLFPLNMGIGGAALATGISQTLGAIFFLGYFIYKTLRQHPGLAFGIPGGGFSALRSIAMNGSSELFNNLAGGLTILLYNRAILNYIGAMGVAAFALVQYLLLFGIVVFVGLSNGAQPILSYNHGAGLNHRVRGTLYRLLVSSVAVGFSLFVTLRWQGAFLATLFIPGHQEALELSLQIANIVSWSMLFMPVGVVVSMFFTALENARSSLIVAVSRGLIFTVIGISIFPLLWGETGIWLTPVFAEGLTALVAIFLIYRWLGQPQVNIYVKTE